jgi:hypothetical protein
MDECIEREAAYNAIVRNYTVDDQLSDLDKIPAADVVPVVRGKWVWDDGEDMHYYCSCCHHNAYGRTCEILDGEYNYCPNCGAKMDKDGE